MLKRKEDLTISEVEKYKEIVEKEIAESMADLERNIGLRIEGVSFVNRDDLDNPSISLNLKV